jgi:deoxyribose-phosphate aldolase
MLASYLDSTNLKADSRREDIIDLCQRAAELEMAAVCVNPVRVSLARQVLQGSKVGLATVVAFPLGATPAQVKQQEALRALKDGANELDVVINGGAVKDRDFDLLSQEIKLLLQLKEEFNYTLKIIVETAMLTVDELKQLTRLLGDAGVDYIKTSTGLGSRGVSMEDIRIINEVRKPQLKIKASGGIKTLGNFLGQGWIDKITGTNGYRTSSYHYKLQSIPGVTDSSSTQYGQIYLFINLVNHAQSHRLYGRTG